MSKIAVIDLGTNTFHLIIASLDENHNFSVVHRQQFFVKLAEGGIGMISKAAFDRGLKTLAIFKESLDKFEVTNVRAIGTAALRTAANGRDFMDTVRSQTGISIELISGQEEAEIIYKGVKAAVPFSTANHLIIDVGGGSVEFILADHLQVHWMQSFPIGAAILFKEFHHHEPIQSHEINQLNTFLKKTLGPLQQVLETFKVPFLIGASGTFDVLEDLLVSEKPLPNSSQISIEDFHKVYDLTIPLNREDRVTKGNIPDQRADMIVVALILVKYVLSLAQFEKIFISNYALKEGILTQIIENQN